MADSGGEMPSLGVKRVVLGRFRLFWGFSRVGVIP